MNFYIIVEGDRTELSVYPAWLKILNPNYIRIDNPWDVSENNYYLFSAGGIPSIYDHVVNAIEDINNINNISENKFDYLLICLDAEEESEEYHNNKINSKIIEKRLSIESINIRVFVQKVCMETWFMANRSVFKDNPQDKEYINYRNYYNVGDRDPEEMENIDEERFSTTAKFHLKYLKLMLEERNISYSKNNTIEVQKQTYLQQLIKRYKTTGHIKTFGSWYEFIKEYFK